VEGQRFTDLTNLVTATQGVRDAVFTLQQTILGTPGFSQDIAAIAALTGTGILARTGMATWSLRLTVAPAAGLTITNPGGVAGNVTFALANDLAAVEGLSGTGLATRTAADTWTTRSVAAGASILVTNGDGVAGNPTVAVDIGTSGAKVPLLNAANTWSAIQRDATAVVVASLPAAGSQGRRSFVTDANATTFASIVAGGGANIVPVFDDGTNWRIG
jgi:hypothetical protein